MPPIHRGAFNCSLIIDLVWHLFKKLIPFSGMWRGHGKEMGVIECWYTKADKLPETKKKKKRLEDCKCDRLEGI